MTNAGNCHALPGILCSVRVLLLHNPNAGDGRTEVDRLRELLVEQGHDLREASSKNGGFAKELRRDPEVLIVAGGDGTAHKLLDHIDEITMPLAMLPAGTSNNIARSLGFPENPDAFAGALRSSVTRSLDLGIATGPWGERPFLESLGIGILAAVNDREAVGETREEKLRLAWDAVQDALSKAKPVHLDITADGEQVAGDFLLAEFTSLPLVGPTLALAGGASATDGFFDLALLQEDHREAMHRWLDNPQGPAPVDVIRAAHFSFDFPGGRLRIDDNTLKSVPAGPVTIERHPMSFRVLCPPATH